ncbi:MAG: hypothetical protein QHH15_00010 [Candidatus Thermoplasmatota archaeon]|nr:hypothetical protein [Candidatus Thermoplasmatota archaeon]
MVKEHDLIGFLSEEDQFKLEKKTNKENRKVEQYIKKCDESGNSVVSVDTIPDWLSEKNGISNGDIVEMEAQTEKAIMVTKMKRPLFKQVVVFQVWLPKSQIDYSFLSVDAYRKGR